MPKWLAAAAAPQALEVSSIKFGDAPLLQRNSTSSCSPALTARMSTGVSALSVPLFFTVMTELSLSDKILAEPSGAAPSSTKRRTTCHLSAAAAAATGLGSTFRSARLCTNVSTTCQVNNTYVESSTTAYQDMGLDIDRNNCYNPLASILQVDAARLSAGNLLPGQILARRVPSTQWYIVFIMLTYVDYAHEPSWAHKLRLRHVWIALSSQKDMQQFLLIGAWEIAKCVPALVIHHDM